MNISVNRDSFFQAVQKLARITTNRSSIQALAGIHIVASESKIRLEATDLEISLSVEVAAQVDGSGDFVLPGKLLADITRTLSGESVEIGLAAAGGGATLKSGKAEFDLMVIPGEDFPKIPNVDPETAVAVSNRDFVDTVSWVIKAASHDETRPILTSVQVVADESTLRMVATDSYRLCIKETGLEKPVTKAIEANIPARALQELTRLETGDDAGDLLVSMQEGQVVFGRDGIGMVSRLMDGQFPNHSQLVPDSFEHELRLNGVELLEVVSRIGLMAQKNSPLKLALTEGQATVSAQSPDVGKASEVVPVPFSGEAVEIGFNPDFLKEGLEGVRSDDLVMKLIGPLRPVMVTSGSDSGYTCLIMPVRLNN